MLRTFDLDMWIVQLRFSALDWLLLARIVCQRPLQNNRMAVG